jgi:cobalt-zinc-cadmium efflux system outer membrane protein
MTTGCRSQKSGRRSIAIHLFVLSMLISGLGAAQQADGSLPNPLRLQDVTRFAREHRAEIGAARARARAARERPAIVSGLEDPMIFPSLDHVPFMLHGVNWSLTVEQRFPLSRVLGNRRRAAEADFDRARADAERARLDVELDAAGAFLMLEERRQMAQILQEQRALAQQFVSAAIGRYAAGAGAHADALRAEMEASRFDGAVRAIAAEVRGAELMLNTSLGRTVDAFIPPLGDSLTTAVPPSQEAVRSAALGQRPELRAGSAEIRKAEAEVTVMKSMYAPMAMVRTGAATTMADGAGWMLMVGVSVPIWRQRLSAGVAEANAMVDMARSDVRGMRTMIEGDALSSRERVIALRERFLALNNEVVPRAQQTIPPTLAGYASGQLPLVSVIDAAQALWNAQSELVSAQFELGLAWARLERAMASSGRP